MFESVFQKLEEGIPGFRAASVVGGDGIEVESHVNDTLPHDVLSAELNAVVRNLDRLKDEIGLGRLEEIALRTESENIFMARLSPDLALLVVTQRSEVTGRTRYQIQRMAHQFIERI
ncbi:MAG: roadblock/LC7 domain-containing protein [Acidobacteriota bacterium]|jgi:predicted regulator of Ras-like GTPase activity (Roadblock/LC7/MglB family)